MNKVEHAVSSGGVIYKKSKPEIKVAVAIRGKGKIFCLPKGLVERGEKPEETASREVKEETGLTGRLVDKIDSIEYWFNWSNKKIHKKVYFYLFKYLSGKTSDHDYELEDVKWFPIDEAIKKLTYKNEKEIMKKAKQLILKLK